MSGDDVSLSSYEDIASHYLQRWGQDVRQECEWYGPRCRSLGQAIERACLSQLPSGRGAKLLRHPHQRRIPGAILAEAARILGNREVELAAARTFDRVLEIVDDAISPIPGVGELLVYDVAYRVGGFLGLQPDRVYLHPGTREAAHALGLPTNRGSIPLSEFPAALRSLRADQIEDVLCIYRATLLRLHTGRSENPAASRGIRRCR
jgi:hypothetical protein